MELSPRQLKLLKKHRFLPCIYTEFGDSDKEILDSLSKFELINPIDDFLFITEKGRAVLHANFLQTMKFWVPNILSSFVSLSVGYSIFLIPYIPISITPTMNISAYTLMPTKAACSMYFSAICQRVGLQR